MSERKRYTLYDQSHVEAVYRRGEWDDWGQLRQWLEAEGERDGELSPAEAHHLGEDVRCLQEEGVSFVPDPAEAYEVLREWCQHDLVRA